ncbi:hypothetical protein N474_19845 [Pseudoalteromonas luteoviolacea CPMOR-2]|uniref:Solute-binding protein family 3/N-terminal domain-containing protein n=1 Tax=Pseudoalteromonas luteoviolacea DSM 6061 TaxID=1365250 RepID=A0A166UUP3_9GAMM|nr:hypothetical protein [Pseudoalteromonas luteoviolacea]KZN30831.1 hypothetical protein N475_24175 [Pseudoalteromonas luteoviolacea DSM 6061]KZN53588.1 hypothetical protein N474_19845 [Pseudoalteromonas luteoviolacea CPMOR-2]MBE0386614.1 hypothetical protein [Pseudoalteromonas luteoviolacea DSM 6061]
MPKPAFIVVILSFTLFFSAHGKDIISVPVNRDIYHYTQQILSGRDLKEITPEIFNHPLCQRDIVDLVLIQKALILGNSSLSFEFVLIDHEEQETHLLKSGLLLVSVDTMWLSQVQPLSNSVLISSPIIRKGEYYAGIFTAPKNTEKLAQKIGKNLSQVSVVSNENWTVDWQTLKQLKPRTMFNESEWIIMAKLVSHGWVDIMLVSFNNTTDFRYSGDGYVIEAIKGIKVALQDSRHFVISRKHPRSQQTFREIELGIKRLRKANFIEKSYRNCGFLTNLVDKWREIP